MNYLVKYVVGCTPKLKKFDDKTKLNNWIMKFYNKHPINIVNGNPQYEDNWIDYVIKGSKLEVDFYTDYKFGYKP